MGQAMGSVFGQQTDAEKAQGPNSGLSGGQQFARGALTGGLGGLANGLKGMGQPAMPRNVGAQINVPQAPMVDPAMFGMGKPKNPFYGS